MPIANLIKTISSGVNEVGKIKIGMKGAKKTSSKGNTFQMPQKVDHFIITTMDTGPDGNFVPDHDLMKKLIADHGDADGKLRKIPITLLYDDLELNFRCIYSRYSGRTQVCRGDGEVAEERQQNGTWKERSCSCPALEAEGANKCKINGRISVMIRGANRLGGAWMFRTTSFNTTKGLIGSLQLIKQISGGCLQGIPLWLKLVPKNATDPKGNPVTIYVVNLEFDGNQEALMGEGYKVLENRVKHNIRMENVEQEARKFLSAKPTSFVDENGEITDEGIEFHPEQQEGFDEQKVVERPKSSRKQSPKKEAPKEVEEATVIEEHDPIEEMTDEQFDEHFDNQKNESESNQETNDWGDF